MASALLLPTPPRNHNPNPIAISLLTFTRHPSAGGAAFRRWVLAGDRASARKTRFPRAYTSRPPSMPKPKPSPDAVEEGGGGSAEVETYKTVDPATRVLILKALCDIRVEQDDIRNYIESSLKNGIHLSEFRRERLGGDSYGISYWYEDDPVVGHRLYREVRRVELKKLKEKGVLSFPLVSYQWETVATQKKMAPPAISVDLPLEKLFSSENRTEVMLGKKLKIDLLPDIETIHKRKDRLLKKQQRAALPP